MKIALICPSNILYMPYIQYYTNILEKLNINYDIINWDRFGNENSNESVFRDYKIGHRRNFMDYYKFSEFIYKNLDENVYDKLIVFGIQLAFFMKKKLMSSYPDKYILDIRDYNKLIAFFNVKEVIEKSDFTVISSPGFLEWLPKSSKYIVNHNADVLNIDELKKSDDAMIHKDYFNISYIGSLRDYEINIKIIHSLKNSKIRLYYHGDGIINDDLKGYLASNKIMNVNVTGRYSKIDEGGLYNQSDLVNVLIPIKDKNSRTLLPNRLYNAVKYGKPVIVFDGTYTANIVEKYNLGIIVNSFKDIEKNILEYISDFDAAKFDEYRTVFTKNVLSDNAKFTSNIVKFTKN